MSDVSFTTDSEYSWKNNVEWDSGARQLVVYPRWVTHTDGLTTHNYAIRLNLDDISSLIGLLGHAGSATDAKALRSHLRKHIPAIVKLLACAAGIAPSPIEPKIAKKKNADS